MVRTVFTRIQRVLCLSATVLTVLCLMAAPAFAGDVAEPFDLNRTVEEPPVPDELPVPEGSLGQPPADAVEPPRSEEYPPPAEPAPETFLGDFGERHIEQGLFDHLLGWKNEYDIPIKLGAWHWYHESLDDNDGYGPEGLRGTYWWEIIADPEFDLGGGRKIGGHLDYRLRDGDFFRSFFDSKFWSYEAYGYYSSEELGTLKAGQVWKRFGLDWDGVFFGNVPYFDGFKLDPDYGLSWEKTTVIHDQLRVDSFVQFYFHEDGVNGSFGGADSESLPGFTERNTGVVRLIATWTLADNSTLAVGFSGMVGEIDSDRIDVDDQVNSAWAIDATYVKDRWKLFGEVLQAYGTRNPNRFVSGGASNRLTDFLVGAHYTSGPVTYRASYSLGLDDNPSGEQSVLVTGATVQLTEHVELYVEYVDDFIDGNDQTEFNEFFNSLNFIIHWQY